MHTESRKLDRDPLIGKTIDDKYQIIDFIGSGGMGRVYKAKQILMNQIVAIKILPKELTEQQQSMKRFAHEAKAASKIEHINVVSVRDFGICKKNGIAYLVMPCVEGTSLRDLLTKEGRLSIERSLPIFIQICTGLTKAHSQGVVHRDIKPSNIILIESDGEKDVVKIIDFGIAKMHSIDGATVLETLTGTTETIGSPHYMSPEQCSNKEIDFRSDIYSLGCLMYETLTGQPPFSGKEFAAILMLHMTADAPHLVIPDEDTILVQRIDAIIQKCLAKEPAMRYQNIRNLEPDLESAKLRDKELREGKSNPFISTGERIWLISSRLLRKLVDAIFSVQVTSSEITVGTILIIAVAVLFLTMLAGGIFLYNPIANMTISARELSFKPITDSTTKLSDERIGKLLWERFKLASVDKSIIVSESTLDEFIRLAETNKKTGRFEIACWWYLRAEQVLNWLQMDDSILGADVYNSYAYSCLSLNTLLGPPSQSNKEQLTLKIKQFGKFVDPKILREEGLATANNAAAARDAALKVLSIMQNLGKTENTSEELLALGLLARSFQELGENEEAQGNYDKFYRILTSQNFSTIDRTQLAFLLASAAVFYIEHNQFEKSETLVKYCSELLMDFNVSSQYDCAVLYNNWGLIKEMLGEAKKAQSFFQQARIALIQSSDSDPKDLDLILNNIVVSSIKAGDYRTALQCKLDELFAFHGLRPKAKLSK